MTRVGNPFPPAGLGLSNVLHAWSLCDDTTRLWPVVSGLEGQLEEQALAGGTVLITSPSFETFRPTDPYVPADLLVSVPAAALDGRPLLIVHAYAVVDARNTPVRQAQAGRTHAP